MSYPPLERREGFHDSQPPVLKLQKCYGGIGVIRLGEFIINQHAGPGTYLLDFADQEASKIQVMNRHVQKKTATP